jgi:flavin-dependent dehydrogenase
VGAGPAGAFAAENLARAGVRVTIFDPRGAWEKPCGGGVPARALGRYAFLLDDPAWPKRPIERVTLVGHGERLSIEFRRPPMVVYARERLNALLLGRAQAAGAEFVRESAVRFDREGDGWRVGTRSGEWRVDALVGADGAGSVVRRRLLGNFRSADLGLTLGYYGPAEGSAEAIIEFPANFTGYLWAFPRTDHMNFGIFNRLGERTSKELKAMLHRFVDAYYGGPAPYERMEYYGAKAPMLAHGSWERLTAAGPGWALVGDAAGFVDPITGEGIYFAMRSGELLASALAGGAGTEGYERAWRRDFGEDLAHASRRMERFYRGRFLGASFIDRTLLFARWHAGIRRVMCRALGGEQSYATLKRDLILNAARPF